MSQYLDALVLELKAARIAAVTAKTAENEYIKRISDTDEAKELYAAKKSTAANVESLEAQIRIQAEKEYIETKDKHPHGKVEIKLQKKFIVKEPGVLRGWVLKTMIGFTKVNPSMMDDVRAILAKHNPKTLDVDEKAVESYAKKNTVPGVEFKEEPKVYIDAEL